MNSAYSGSSDMVCQNVCRVCNSGIPDAYDLARQGAGPFYASLTFSEDYGLSPGVWCHIRVTLHGSAWSLPLERHCGA